LRRVHVNGLGSLSRDEKQFLDRVAAELRFELGWDKRNPDYEDFE
jgi:hypothetical protein